MSLVIRSAWSSSLNLVIPQLGRALSPKAPFPGRLGETTLPKIEGLLNLQHSIFNSLHLCKTAPRMKSYWKQVLTLAGIVIFLSSACVPAAHDQSNNTSNASSNALSAASTDPTNTISVANTANASSNALSATSIGKTGKPLDAPSSDNDKSPTQIWLTFGLNHIEWLQAKPLAGIPLWQFFASIIYIFLAFYVSKFLDFFIRERLQKWAEKTETKFDDILINLLRGPVKVVSFVILLHIGMEVYSWPAGFSRFLSSALKIVVALSITYVLLKAVDAAIGVWREKTTTPENEQFSRQLLPLIGKTLKVFMVIVVLLVTSQNLGLNVTGLIASLSIGGLAIGLAAQDTLANLFGAVAVLVDRPFKVGDRVQLESVDGTVESIGFRSTRIRNLDGHLVTVPNKTMGNATITNITLRPNLKTVMNFGLTYDTPPEKIERAEAIIRETFQGPMTADLLVTFDKFTDSTLNIQVLYWWKGVEYKDFLSTVQKANLTVLRRFAEEKIEFAFPSTTVYLRQESPEDHGLRQPEAGVSTRKNEPRKS